MKNTNKKTKIGLDTKRFVINLIDLFFFLDLKMIRYEENSHIKHNNIKLMIVYGNIDKFRSSFWYYLEIMKDFLSLNEKQIDEGSFTEPYLKNILGEKNRMSTSDSVVSDWVDMLDDIFDYVKSTSIENFKIENLKELQKQNHPQLKQLIRRLQKVRTSNTKTLSKILKQPKETSIRERMKEIRFLYHSRQNSTQINNISIIQPIINNLLFTQNYPVEISDKLQNADFELEELADYKPFQKASYIILYTNNNTNYVYEYTYSGKQTTKICQGNQMVAQDMKNEDTIKIIDNNNVNFKNIMGKIKPFIRKRNLKESFLLIFKIVNKKKKKS